MLFRVALLLSAVIHSSSTHIGYTELAHHVTPSMPNKAQIEMTGSEHISSIAAAAAQHAQQSGLIYLTQQQQQQSLPTMY